MSTYLPLDVISCDCSANWLSECDSKSLGLRSGTTRYCPGLQGALLQCGLILLSGLLLWAFRSDEGGYAAIH